MTAAYRHITIVGSGKVAGFLARVFSIKGLPLKTITGRNKQSAEELAEKYDAEFSESVPSESDLIILAVKDDAISEVASKLDTTTNALVCHTSGAMSSDLLNRFVNHGVLYPLQSIRGELSAEMVPMLIETNTETNTEAVLNLMQSCGFNCSVIDSRKRSYYHLAAVFANNFSNAMLAAAEEISDQYKLDSSLLKPLVRKTFESALASNAGAMQTGPALRNDINTMQKHLNMLEENKEMQDLYRSVSAYISKKNKY